MVSHHFGHETWQCYKTWQCRTQVCVSVASGPTNPGSLLGNFLLLSAVKQWQGRQRQWRTPSLSSPPFPCTPISWDSAGKWACGTQISRYQVCFLVKRTNTVSGILSRIKGSVRVGLSMSCTTHTHMHPQFVSTTLRTLSLSVQCPFLSTEVSTYK